MTQFRPVMRTFHFSTALSLGLLVACGPAGVPVFQPTARQQSQISTARQSHVPDSARQMYEAEIRRRRESYRPADSYRGRVSLQIGELRWGTGSASDHAGNGFRIQALPEGPVIYQESFQILAEHTPLEISRELTVSAPEKRYTLHIQNGNGTDPESRAEQIVLRINGIPLLQTGRLSPEADAEILREALTLLPETQLTLQLHGPESAQITLTLIESEHAGVIISRQQVPGAPDQIPDPLFDPGNPQGIFAALPAAPGNQNLPLPETTTAVISLNGHPPEPVINGQYFVEVAEPVQANLAHIQDKYQARILQGPLSDTWFVIQLDMTRIDLSQLEPQLRQLNAQTSDPYLLIQEAHFGNLESARTLAGAVALSFEPEIESVGFNPVLDISSQLLPPVIPSHEVVQCAMNASSNCWTDEWESIYKIQTFEDDSEREAVTVNAQAPTTGDASVGFIWALQSENFWWLNHTSTFVDSAWLYSTGFSRVAQRPIRVAVIDRGFAGLPKANQPGGDLAGRVLFEGPHAGALISHDPRLSDILFVQNWTASARQQEDERFQLALNTNASNIAGTIHGTQVASTIASGINDGVGIAGVAPRVEIMPFRLHPTTSTSWADFLLTAKIAVERGADVINTSLNIREAQNYMKGYFDTISRNSWVTPTQEFIRWASAAPQNVIFINSAGNMGWNALYSLPGKLFFPEMIVVGAVDGHSDNYRRVTGQNYTNGFTIGTRRQVDYWNHQGPGNPARWDTVGIGFMAGLPHFMSMETAPEYITRMHSSNFDLYSENAQRAHRTIAISSSNYGNEFSIDIWAPGNDMITIGPANHQDAQNHYWSWGGTSAAAPIIAGVVALMKALKPDMHVEEARQILKNTARKRTYEDRQLRSWPFLDSGLSQTSECGSIKPQLDTTNDPNNQVVHINCGRPLTDPSERQLTIRLANALRAVTAIPGIAPDTVVAKNLYGYLLPSGQFTTLTGQSYQLFNQSDPPFYVKNTVYTDQNPWEKSGLPWNTSEVEVPEVSPPGSYFTNLKEFAVYPLVESGETATSEIRRIGANPIVRRWLKHRYSRYPEALQEQSSPEPALVRGWQRNDGRLDLLSVELLPPDILAPYDPWASPEPTPGPTATATANPESGSFPFTAPVRVSQPGSAANTRPPAESTTPSILRDGGTNGAFASFSNILGANHLAGPPPAAQWVGLVDPQQAVTTQYPVVPNTHDLDNTSESFRLRVLLQVRNQGHGGTAHVNVSGHNMIARFGPGTAHPNAELKPIILDFRDAANEYTGIEVSIRVENAQPGIQLIYKFFAVPNP